MFLNQPAFRYDHTDAAGRVWYELAEPLTLDMTLNGGSFCVRVPAGFQTDGASVPRFFWRILPPMGRYWRPAVLHDYLYRAGTCSRFLADAVFRDAMRADGVSAWKRLAMYYAVRVFGGRSWRSRR